jgi:hypothetical protein
VAVSARGHAIGVFLWRVSRNRPVSELRAVVKDRQIQRRAGGQVLVVKVAAERRPQRQIEDLNA